MSPYEPPPTRQIAMRQEGLAGWWQRRGERKGHFAIQPPWRCHRAGCSFTSPYDPGLTETILDHMSWHHNDDRKVSEPRLPWHATAFTELDADMHPEGAIRFRGPDAVLTVRNIPHDIAKSIAGQTNRGADA